METSICLPYRTGVQDTDLIAVFGNLLDNAAEACMDLPPAQRSISLSAHSRGGYLCIHMENACSPQGEMARAARIDGLARGLGGLILSDIARQYHGDFSARAEGNTYVSDITLLMDEALL